MWLFVFLYFLFFKKKTRHRFYINYAETCAGAFSFRSISAQYFSGIPARLKVWK